jgi:hypothetical protein
MSFISGYITFSQMPQSNGRNGALNANFLANGQKFKNLSLPAKVNPMLPDTPSATSHQQSTVSLTMKKELCLGCHRWFSRMEQHLVYNPICWSVMNEHDQWQNVASHSRCTNITTNELQDDSDPILGIEVVACHPQPEDNTSTAHSTRHAKKQRLADRDDDQSKITYINGGINVEYGSHHAMTTSPGFDGGWDNDMSSKGTMEAVLALEDDSTFPSHNPHCQSTPNHTIQPSSYEEFQLGATFLMPIIQCITHMAPNTATEDALLELYMTLSRAGAQLLVSIQ